MIKCLIADDEDVIRKGIRSMVESSGLGIQVVSEAGDGEEAIREVRLKKPEIILADVNMPKLNGLDFVERANEIVPDSIVIIISGYDDFKYVQRALRLRVYDFILKPVNRGNLYSTLSGAVYSIYKKDYEPIKDMKDEDIIDMAVAKIEERYSDDELRLSTIADEMFVSTAYLSRGIKERVGKTFSDYLTDIRIRKAIDLMTHSKSVMIYSVAEQVGYSSQHYFCRIFKEYTGCTPSEYMRRLKEEK